MKFIKLTECYTSETKVIYINVEMVQAMYFEGNRTRLKHPSHNNGGWYVKETPEKILELIKKIN
jgi:hypothetical protein